MVNYMKNKILLIIVLILLGYLIFISKEKDIKKKEETSVVEKRAIFISYIELQKYLKDKDEKTAKENINKIINNLRKLKFNFILLQVRSFSDAIYESSYYPWSKTISSTEGDTYSFDVLDYFIKISHENDIELHAWINPYRIRTTSNINDISKTNPAYKLLNTNDVDISDKGIYYNPASTTVQKLILDGVEEILKKYDVDGIHYDDYFYPNLDIDNKNYEEYIKNNDEITKEEFHLLMVNNLVKETYKLTKKYNVSFGISPEGNIKNNYTRNQADVYTWGSSNEYVDYLMPQIYYGFENESAPFYDVLNEWNNLVKNSKVKIIPALAFYKINQKDIYAKKGENEWIENNDIIYRQIILSRNIESYAGFSIFRYDSVFNEEQTIAVNQEIKNMKKAIEN